MIRGTVFEDNGPAKQGGKAVQLFKGFLLNTILLAVGLAILGGMTTPNKGKKIKGISMIEQLSKLHKN